MLNIGSDKKRRKKYIPELMYILYIYAYAMHSMYTTEEHHERIMLITQKCFNVLHKIQ